MTSFSPITLRQVVASIAAGNIDDNLVDEIELEDAGLDSSVIIAYDDDNSGDTSTDALINYLEAQGTAVRLHIEGIDFVVLPDSAKTVRESLMEGLDLFEEYNLQSQVQDPNSNIAFLCAVLNQITDPEEQATAKNIEAVAQLLSTQRSALEADLLSAARRNNLLVILRDMTARAMDIRIGDRPRNKGFMNSPFMRELKVKAEAQLKPGIDSEGQIMQAFSNIRTSLFLGSRAFYLLLSRERTGTFFLTCLSALFDFIPSQQHKELEGLMRKVFSFQDITDQDLEILFRLCNTPNYPRECQNLFLASKSSIWNRYDVERAATRYRGILENLSLALDEIRGSRIPLDSWQVSDEQREAFYRQQLIGGIENLKSQVTQVNGGGMPSIFATTFINQTLNNYHLGLLPQIYDSATTNFLNPGIVGSIREDGPAPKGRTYFDYMLGIIDSVCIRKLNKDNPSHIAQMREIVETVNNIKQILIDRAKRDSLEYSISEFRKTAREFIYSSTNATHVVDAFLGDQTQHLGEARALLIRAKILFDEDEEAAAKLVDEACVHLQIYQNTSGKEFMPLSLAHKARTVARNRQRDNISTPYLLQPFEGRGGKFNEAIDIALFEIEGEKDPLEDLHGLWKEYSETLDNYLESLEQFERGEIDEVALQESERLANRRLIALAEPLADIFIYLQEVRGSGQDLRDEHINGALYYEILETRRKIANDITRRAQKVKFLLYADKITEQDAAKIMELPEGVKIPSASERGFFGNLEVQLGLFRSLVGTFYLNYASSVFSEKRKTLEDAFSDTRTFTIQEFNPEYYKRERRKKIQAFLGPKTSTLQTRDRKKVAVSLTPEEWSILYKSIPSLRIVSQSTGYYALTMGSN